ncbi:UNVERIFIED_CONTAM: hypothetical protein GTU68_062840, partial [Idotea baltica]|nr:hypothetical protein [Idotea baltica]
YLLDTNICIYYFKGLYHLENKIREVNISNCFISEITLAELRFGAENSPRKEKLHKIVDEFQSIIQIIPIYSSIGVYAKEKARLKKAKQLIDDFDLLIASTALEYNMVMVTNNIKHFDRITNLVIEDWRTIKI